MLIFAFLLQPQHRDVQDRYTYPMYYILTKLKWTKTYVTFILQGFEKNEITEF